MSHSSELGGSYHANHAVERIEPRAGEFRLHTANGEIAAARFVLAAGLGNARLAPMVGLDAPVRPQRGQIMVTEKVAPFMNHVVHTIRQTDEGGVMISDSVEEAGYDPSVGERGPLGHGGSRDADVSPPRAAQCRALLGGAARHAAGRISDL